MICLPKQRYLPLLAVAAIISNNVEAQSPSDVRSFEYDALGNLKVQRNSLLHTTKQDYDALSRVKALIDPNEKRTEFEYDLSDQLTKVIDPRKVTTGYTIDGLGKLSQLSSGDTGVTITQFDEAGNLVLSTDAKKQTTQFKYDALNRIELITYSDNSTVTYLYDQHENAIGRLSKIIDTSGSVTYEYDKLGNIISDTRVIGGSAYTTGYRYDQFGRLAGLDYPSGRKIDYGYDALGRVATISSQKGGAIKSLVTDVSYVPFGGVEKITFGNGRFHLRTYDLDGRLESYTLNNKTMTLAYDSGNRLTRVADTASPMTGTTYDYDKNERLISVITPTLSQVYGYDDAGNRITKQINGSIKTLTYAPTSNRLTAVDAQPVSTDENGSITNRGDGVFTYDVRGRLVSFEGASGLVTYSINALGQRVRKIAPTGTTVFHYDMDGKLIAESTTDGVNTNTQEYVYLGDIPVAVLK